MGLALNKAMCRCKWAVFCFFNICLHIVDRHSLCDIMGLPKCILVWLNLHLMKILMGSHMIRKIVLKIFLPTRLKFKLSQVFCICFYWVKSINAYQKTKVTKLKTELYERNANTRERIYKTLFRLCCIKHVCLIWLIAMTPACCWATCVLSVVVQVNHRKERC